jgi:hypothetical protein
VLADTGSVQVYASVSSVEAAALQAGEPVQVTRGDQRLPGHVGWVGFEPVDAGATGPRYRLTVMLDNPPDAPLRIGESVELTWE